MQARVKLWLEQDGRLAFSDYRARLLRLVRDTGSLSQAAAAMGLSYRRAWGKIRELEQNLGVELVQSDVGGPGGGGSRLTDAGEALLQRYESLSEALDAALEALQKCYLPERSEFRRPTRLESPTASMPTAGGPRGPTRGVLGNASGKGRTTARRRAGPGDR